MRVGPVLRIKTMLSNNLSTLLDVMVLREESIIETRLVVAFVTVATFIVVLCLT